MGSPLASHWMWLAKWVHEPWLLWWKCFPDKRLGWLVSETQQRPTYVYLQAVTYRWGWLHTEGGLSAELYFPHDCSPAARLACCQGIMVKRKFWLDKRCRLSIFKWAWYFSCYLPGDYLNCNLCNNEVRITISYTHYEGYRVKDDVLCCRRAYAHCGVWIRWLTIRSVL